MKKEQVKKYINLFGIPLLTTVLGLILLFNPDSATALIAKIVGWLLVVTGAVKAISMADKRTMSNPAGWLLAAVGIILGIVLLRNPLLLAKSIGRFLGILLVIRGGADLRNSVHQKARILAVVTLVVGAVLILMPLTLTHTLLRLCGVVVAAIGIINIVEKLTELKLLENGSDRTIIDADD